MRIGVLRTTDRQTVRATEEERMMRLRRPVHRRVGFGNYGAVRQQLTICVCCCAFSRRSRASSNEMNAPAALEPRLHKLQGGPGMCVARARVSEWRGKESTLAAYLAGERASEPTRPTGLASVGLPDSRSLQLDRYRRAGPVSFPCRMKTVT